jgi:hypothetical protein
VIQQVLEAEVPEMIGAALVGSGIVCTGHRKGRKPKVLGREATSCG